MVLTTPSELFAATGGTMTMLPPAVVEQQAKLGVSAEESKALRLKRQQARFRDRGGAFVPSTSNPLVDILLARTVSGESPSKARPKKRLSSSKTTRQTSPTKVRVATVIPESHVVAGSSKPEAQVSGKGKARAIEPEELVTRPPPKRRATAKGKKKTLDKDSDVQQLRPTDTKSKSVPKGKGKQRTTRTGPDDNPKTKPKLKAKAKSNAAKVVVEVLDSDDDQTLVEVPRKAQSNPKKQTRYEDDDETDDDAPIIRKRAVPRVGNSKTSDAKAAPRAKTEKIAASSGSGKRAVEDGEERTQDEKRSKTTARKRPVSRDEEDQVAPPAKKGKAANSTSAKPKIAIEPEPASRPTEDLKSGNSKVTTKGKGKVKAAPVKDVPELVEGDGEQHVERVSKPKKRKKEEDNYDDRPRKAIKSSEIALPHSSSQKLKENQLDKKRERTSKSVISDEPDEPREKLATKASSRAKTAKGPPREVLERIKASAARHLRCVDSEPDELDCLS